MLSCDSARCLALCICCRLFSHRSCAVQQLRARLVLALDLYGLLEWVLSLFLLWSIHECSCGYIGFSIGTFSMATIRGATSVTVEFLHLNQLRTSFGFLYWWWRRRWSTRSSGAQHLGRWLWSRLSKWWRLRNTSVTSCSTLIACPRRLYPQGKIGIGMYRIYSAPLFQVIQTYLTSQWWILSKLFPVSVR